MKIIVTQIPENVTRRQLQEFLTHPFYLFDSIRLRSVDIAACDINTITDDRTGLEEWIGLARVSPEKSARHIIKRCHGRELDGKRVIVRQYFDRVGTDRRLAEIEAFPFPQRRPDERRRTGLVFQEDVDVIWTVDKEIRPRVRLLRKAFAGS
jgi:hypothetical protein